jgi:hypothetical protein
MWYANFYFQPVVYRNVVLKYIAKYASKEEKRSESYQDKVTRISNYGASKDHALFAYIRFLVETLFDHDIGAQETFHMLLKLPHVLCSQKFVSLNIGRKVFKKNSKDTHQFSSPNNFVEKYQQRPYFIKHLCLIEKMMKYIPNVRKRNRNIEMSMPFLEFGHIFILLPMRLHKTSIIPIELNLFCTNHLGTFP